jgi:hypothetical protein
MVLPAEAISTIDHQATTTTVGGPAGSVHIDRATIIGSSNSSQAAVSVVVPAIAVIRVDDDGQVLAAMTNTGRPPQPNDQHWLMFLDGTMQPATAERFSDHVWIGDFADPGVYVAQTQ